MLWLTCIKLFLQRLKQYKPLKQILLQTNQWLLQAVCYVVVSGVSSSEESFGGMQGCSNRERYNEHYVRILSQVPIRTVTNRNPFLLWVITGPQPEVFFADYKKKTFCCLNYEAQKVVDLQAHVL